MIQIITDSMADILPDEARAMGLRIAPQLVRFGSETFNDGEEISLDAFYRRMETVETLPQTSQTSPAVFEALFSQALAENRDVLCITGSSCLSGTYQSAMLARQSVEAPDRVYIVDSLSASLGESLLVHEAVRLAALGESAAAIAAALEALKPRQRLVGHVEKLKYLVMGGRLPAVAAHLGTALNLRAMLTMNDGALESAGVCRGGLKLLDWYAAKLRKTPPDPLYPIILAAADRREGMEALRKSLDNSGLLPDDVRLMDIGCVIGTHTGPGCVAMAWIARA